jgi:FolB domain-containing protein
MQTATIRITDLMLRTIIGASDWERKTRQDILINFEITFDASRAAATDAIGDTVDYKRLKRRMIDEVERSSYHLLEALTARLLGLVMEDGRVLAAKVRIDKPGALRFAKSVSVEMSGRREP